MFGKKRKIAQEETAAPAAEENKSEQTAAEELSPDTEREEFEEFKKQKKLLEIKRLLKMIDHTLLKQTATRSEIRKLCDEAVEYGFCSVCVQPVYVADCFNFLKNAPAVKIACVVGFPMGENVTATKVFETKRALADGADEIDMVACISAIKNGNFSYVKREIKKVVAAAKGKPVKVILETSLLTQSGVRQDEHRLFRRRRQGRGRETSQTDGAGELSCQGFGRDPFGGAVQGHGQCRCGQDRHQRRERDRRRDQKIMIQKNF